MGDGQGGAKTASLHEWTKKFTGKDPAAPKPAASMAPAPVAPGGPLPAAKSDQQSTEFHTALQGRLTSIDEHLAYTAEHAEDATHQPLAARRATVAGAYEPTAAQIDPSDPAKAKDAIAKVLADADGLAKDAGSCRSAAEQAFNDWQSRQPMFDEAYKQVETLQAWGHAEAPALRSALDGIGAQLDSRTYAEACGAFDKLAPQMKLVWDDYQAQAAAQAQYEPARTALDPRLTAAAASSFKTLQAQQGAFGPATQEMDAAASGKDFVKALQLETSLDGKLGEYEKLLAKLNEQRRAYEAAAAPLKGRIPTTSQPGGERIRALEQAIATQSGQMTAAAEAEDYDTALPLAQDLEPEIAELETALEGRRRYDEQWATLKSRLPQTMTGAAALTELEARIGSLREQSEAAAAADDYDQACTQLTALESAATDYEAAVAKFQEQKQNYEQRWAELKPRLPVATASDATPKIQQLNDSVVQTRSSLEAKAAKSDYESALTDLDTMVRLLSDLDAAKEEAVRKREEFEQAYGKTKQVIEAALATPTDVSAIQQKQDELKACKAKVDDAVARNDYEAATTQLAGVDTALNAYQEELRKQPRNCDWINATATALMAGIMRHYMQAQSKIERAAQAYDEALSEHKKAVAAVDAKKQLVEDFLVGIFFAALGGAAGGAVGGRLKSAVEDEFGKAAKGGAVLDATKDVAKFTSRTLQKLGGSPGNPTAVSGKFGSSGVELARTIGQAVNTQGEALLGEVEKLANMVRSNPGVCDSAEGIRVEGDPAAAIGSDPFLKVLDSIASADKRSFARLLWGAWIEQHAYSIEEHYSKVGVTQSVEDNVEGFFGWWANLTKSIEAQAGSDFGLRSRLDEARSKAQEKVDAYNRARFTGRFTG